jgi:hypothetical protein
MRVVPTHWAPLPCEGVLCSCCGGVVNLSFFTLIFLPDDSVILALNYDVKLERKSVEVLIYYKYSHKILLSLETGFI